MESSTSSQSQHTDLEPSTQEDGKRAVFWQGHVSDWRKSRLSQADYAKTHKLVLSQFGYWKRKFSQAPKIKGSRSFVPVNLPNSTPVRITDPNGLMVECAPGTDVTWLKALLRSLDAS